MREWRPETIDTIVEHKLLEVQRHRLRSGDHRREALVFESPDWVNVVPLLDDGRVVLVRQWRYGVQGFSLEVPGGMVDPGEEPRVAAARELEEETGYRAGRLEPIGAAHPNPALFSNRMTFWLATGLERVAAGPHGDEDEEIEVRLVALDDIPRLIRAGEITHSLPICAFYFLQQAR